MARLSQDVTGAELAVLDVLWSQGPCPIRRISDAIDPDGGTSRYATVQKLLERLEAKGCVQRDRSESVHRFSALIERDDLIGKRLQDVAETLCGGSLTPLLTHLVKAESLSAADRKTLRNLIETLDRDTRSRKA